MNQHRQLTGTIAIQTLVVAPVPRPVGMARRQIGHVNKGPLTLNLQLIACVLHALADVDVDVDHAYIYMHIYICV